MYRLCFTVYLALAAVVAHAHEFWIEPTRFEVPASQRIVADLRVGQYFKGNSQVYLPNSFVSFTVTDSAGSRPVEGRIGDLPAAAIPTERNGLHVLAYHSVPASITYESLEKFSDFARKQDLTWAIDAHRRRGLPETDITEAFTRYAKTLVQVGGVADGSDRALGLPFELVAETNPYSGDLRSVTVRLMLDETPRPDTQIMVFQKFVGCQATRSTVRTDADGRARISVTSGGRFLVNAVHMMEPRPDADADWASLWASLTFGLPENPGDGERQRCQSPGDRAESLR